MTGVSKVSVDRHDLLVPTCSRPPCHRGLTGACVLLAATREAMIVIPLFLGFVGAYAVALVVATLWQARHPWAVTLGLGTVFFLAILLATWLRRQSSKR